MCNRAWHPFDPSIDLFVDIFVFDHACIGMGSIEIEAIATRVRTYQGGIGLERAALKKKSITYIFSSFATNYILLYLDSRSNLDLVSMILTLSSS